MSTSDGVQKRNAFAACADLALPAFRGPLAVSCRIGSSVKRAWRLPRRTAGNQPIVDQCLDPSATRTSVGSGSCGSRRFGLASLQLATFTTHSVSAGRLLCELLRTGAAQALSDKA